MENTGQRARKDIAPSQSGKDKPEKSIERKIKENYAFRLKRSDEI